MRTMTYVAAFSVAGPVLFSCSKETPRQEKEVLKKEVYVLGGQEYTVTWYENSGTAACRLDEGSAANAAVRKFLDDHEQAVVVHDGDAGKSFVYADMQAFAEKREQFFPKHDDIPKANHRVRVSFYEHAHYVNLMFQPTANTTASTLTDPVLVNAVSTLVGPTWGTSKVFYNPWVGTSNNDRISSLIAEKVVTTTKYEPWNYFAVVIYEHLNYGGDAHFFIDSEADLPNITAEPNLQTVSMWGGFNNFNDETTSYWGCAFVH